MELGHSRPLNGRLVSKPLLAFHISIVGINRIDQTNTCIKTPVLFQLVLKHVHEMWSERWWFLIPHKTHTHTDSCEFPNEWSLSPSITACVFVCVVYRRDTRWAQMCISAAFGAIQNCTSTLLFAHTNMDRWGLVVPRYRILHVSVKPPRLSSYSQSAASGFKHWSEPHNGFEGYAEMQLQSLWYCCFF